MKKLMITVAIAATTTTFAQAQTVRIGTEGAYAPYNMINDQGELDGYEIELGNEMCKRAKVDCVWVKNDWDSIIPNLMNANYDAIMAAMSITPERAEIVQFTQNYLPPAASAYVALSEDVDLTGGVVASQAATIQANHVAESGAILLEFPTGEEALTAMRNGEADAVFADKGLLVPFVNDSAGELMFVSNDVMLDHGIGMALRQSDTELTERFNEAIKEMKDDGSINAMIRKWFGEEATVYE